MNLLADAEQHSAFLNLIIRFDYTLHLMATRQLSAIMFADIQGYTALMQVNEGEAVAMQVRFHQSMQDACQNHNGRIAELNGDGGVCVFSSSIEAVHAAIFIQRRMRDQPRIPVRIGIHSGDIVVNGDKIYGNAVNMASRIESFAIPGSVLISEIVFNEVGNQKDIETVSLGIYRLRNIKEPTEIFAVSNQPLEIPQKKQLKGKGIRIANRKKRLLAYVFVLCFVGVAIFFAFYRNLIWKTAEEASEKLKIVAVLPFANLSPSKDDEYFADGMYDEILTQISKIGGLDVISRTSMLQFKGTKKTMKKISQETGADVLLEGSVQKSNDKVRINVQLIDSKNDNHLWAETYDRDMKDIFAIQTDIAIQIAFALNTALTEKEKSLVDEIPTTNVQAHDYYLKGNKYAQSFWNFSNLEEVPQAVRMYEEAIRQDNKFTAPYGALIELYTGISWIKPLLNTDEYDAKAKEWFEKLNALGLRDAHSYNATAIYRYKSERNYESALSQLDTVDLLLGNPKSTYMLRADIFRRMGRIDEAIKYIRKQAGLFPGQARYWSELAETYKLKRNFDSAVFFINKSIALSPDIPGYYVNKAMYYAELKGDVSDAVDVLQNASSLVDTSAFGPDFVYLDILKGDYDNTVLLSADKTDSLGILWQYKIVPNELVVALMYHIQGKHDQAKIYFQKTYNRTFPLSQQFQADFRLHAVTGIALAGLDQIEQAYAEGKKACDLMPVSKDALLGISPLESLALIYTLAGEQDKAIDILEDLLKMPFAWTMSNNIPLYKLYYYWKPLLNNPRFQKLIQ